MSRVALALDESDVELLRAAALEPGDTILAGDPEAYSRARLDGLRATSLWHYVRAEDFDAIRSRLRAAIEFWRQHASIHYLGIDLLRVAGFRHVGWISRFIWAAAALEHWLAQERPSELVVVDEPMGHGLSRPPSQRRFPAFQAIARHLAGLSGATVRSVPGRATLSTGAVDSPGESPERVDAQRSLSDEPFILLHGNGVDAQRQPAIAAALRREWGGVLVQVHKFADDSALRKLRQDVDFVWSEAALASDESDPSAADIACQARTAWQEACERAPALLSSIVANRWLAPHFEFLFGEYAQAIAGHVRTWTRFFAQHRPRAVVCGYQAPIVDVACALGIPCVLLPHGLNMGFAEWYRTMPPGCTIGLLSETQRRGLVRAGIDGEHLAVTGDPSLALRGGPRLPRVEARRRLRIADRGPLMLLCTSQLGRLSQLEDLPTTDWCAALRSIDALGEMLDRRKEWCAAIKRHPRYDHDDLYEPLQRRGLTVFRDEPLDVLVRAADVIVFPNIVSSAIVEAALLDRPVVLLADALVNFRAAEWGLDRWPTVGSVAELDDLLTRAASDPLVLETIRSQTRVAVKHYLAGSPADAAAHSARLILGRARACEETTVPAECL